MKSCFILDNNNNEYNDDCFNYCVEEIRNNLKDSFSNRIQQRTKLNISYATQTEQNLNIYEEEIITTFECHLCLDPDCEIDGCISLDCGHRYYYYYF
jgi:hypothetical protein